MVDVGGGKEEEERRQQKVLSIVFTESMSYPPLLLLLDLSRTFLDITSHLRICTCAIRCLRAGLFTTRGAWGVITQCPTVAWMPL